MELYASSYISGLESLVIKWLKEEFVDLKIKKSLDGLILYETNMKDKKLPFLNNDYIVLATGGENYLDFNKDIAHFVRNLKLNLKYIKKYLGRNVKTFKILTFDKNQPTQIDYNILRNLENDIERELNLNLGERKYDVEFILQRRSEKLILFMLKINSGKKTEKDIVKGSLRPELSYSLCKIADICEKDICMDMFCGSGAIPKQIVKNFKYNMVFASDLNEELINNLKKEYKGNNKHLYIKQRDALDLSYFEDEFIDKIVTDPPWNFFNHNECDFSEFYVCSLKEMNRILKIGGKAVILMGNILEFEKALKQIPLLKVIEKHNILVNGKKANIYVLTK